MESEENKENYNPEIISWQVPEHDKHERQRGWYYIAIGVGLLLLIYAFITKNFLFSGIVIITALIIILTDGKEPALVKIEITDQGVGVGKKFFSFDQIKDFSIVYKPDQGVKNLYFEFKTITKPRLSIELLDQDPVGIRDKLLKYLEEDLDRTEQPLSEGLAKLLKL